MKLNTYKNDFPDTFKQDWVKLLFNNDRPIQSRELLELQSLVQSNTRKVLDTIYRNGTVISGLDITLNKQFPSGIRSFNVSKGAIYIEGNILDVPDSVFTVTDVNATVGVIIKEEIITELEDTSLNDPEKGGELWGAAGAYRLKWTTAIVVNESSMYPIAKIEANNILKIQPVDPIKQLLADYIYDAEGNFIINGFNITSTGSATGTSNTNNLNNLLTEQTSLDNIISDYKSKIQGLVESNNRLNISLSGYKQQILVQYSASVASLIQSSETLITTNNNTINELKNKLNSVEQNKVQLEKDISTEKSSQINLETISISSGIGYVEGNRIVKTNNTILTLQKNLPVSQIYNASFTYSGTASFVSYQLSNLLLGEFISNKCIIRIIIPNVVFNGIENTIQVDISPPNTILSTADINLFIVNEFNNNITTTTLTCNTLSLNNRDLMSVIKQNYEIVLTNSTTFTFKFITLRNSSSIPNISISLLKKDINNTIIGTDTSLTITKVLTNSSSSSLNSYKLGFTPVSSINRLNATLISNSKPIIRGAVPGTIDTLGQATVSKIISVGQNLTSYIEGVDYRLINQSEIDWSLASTREPAPGTTYFVTYLYTSLLTNNVDYTLENDSVKFINRTPAIGQSFSVDYSYFQSKTGLVTLDKNGNIDYILSEAGLNPPVPSIPNYLLPLATFKFRVGPSIFQSLGLNRFTNKDLYELSDRLRQAVFALEDKPELISDNFLTFNSQNLESTNYTAAICPNKQSITNGYRYKEVSIDTLEASRYLIDNYVSLPLNINPTSLLNQDRTTEYRALIKSSYKPILRLSSYSLFFNKTRAKVNPSNSIIGTSSKVINRININNQSLFGVLANTLEESIQQNNAFNSNSYDQESENYISTKTSVLEGLSIDLFLTDLDPSSTNYKIYIDNVLIQTNLILLSGTLSGALNNTFKSNINGKATVRLLLPSDLTTGNHTIEVRNLNYTIKSKFSIFNNLLNHVVFDATNKDSNSAITPPFLLEEPSIYNIEQTFIASDYYLLRSIDLLIDKSPTVSSELTILLLDINRNIISYGEITTFISKKLTVRFINPTLIERDKEYIIAIKSPQSGFTFSVAKINEPDLVTGKYYGSQLFSQGCLYISSDNINSLELTDYDLTFNLYKDTFSQNTKIVNLGTYKGNSITSFALNTRDVIPPKTSITYEYSTDEGVWKEFISNRNTQLDYITNQISIRAVLFTNSLDISPLLLIKGSSISLYSNNSTSTLVSNYVQIGNNYSTVDIKIGFIKTSGSSLLVYHSQQSLNEVWKTCNLTTTSLIDENINLYESIYTVSYNTVATGSKYRLDLVTNDPTKPVTIKYIYVNPKLN